MGATPAVIGVHHVKLPVSGYARSIAWYTSHLGFEVVYSFGDQESPAGAAMRHPSHGVMLGIQVNPDLAAAARGFDSIAFLVENRAALDAWADHLESQGLTHDGLHPASMGTVLALTDPDGHQLLFYATS